MQPAMLDCFDQGIIRTLKRLRFWAMFSTIVVFVLALGAEMNPFMAAILAVSSFGSWQGVYTIAQASVGFGVQHQVLELVKDQVLNPPSVSVHAPPTFPPIFVEYQSILGYPFPKNMLSNMALQIIGLFATLVAFAVLLPSMLGFAVFLTGIFIILSFLQLAIWVLSNASFYFWRMPKSAYEAWFPPKFTSLNREQWDNIWREMVEKELAR